MAAHGTRACYLRGCKDPACLQANANYMRQWRAGKPGYVYNRRLEDRRAEYQIRRHAPKSKPLGS